MKYIWVLLLFAFTLNAQSIQARHKSIINMKHQAAGGAEECTVGMDTVDTGYDGKFDGMGRASDMQIVFGQFWYEGTTISSGETICFEMVFTKEGSPTFTQLVGTVVPDSSDIPDSTPIASWSDSVAVSSIGTDTVYHRFSNIVLSADITNNTMYWLVVKTNGYTNGSNNINVAQTDHPLASSYEGQYRSGIMEQVKTLIISTKTCMMRIYD